MFSLLVSLVAASTTIPGSSGVKLNENESVVLKVFGKGTQNYVCRDGKKFTFKSVDATLTQIKGAKKTVKGTIHYAKRDLPRATWTITTGPVTGTFVGKQAWEKLGAVSTEMATGIFTAAEGKGKDELGKMNYVIAHSCTGGARPTATTCTISEKLVEVDYTCEYWFVKTN